MTAALLIARRLASAVVLLGAMSLLTYGLLSLTPDGPVQALLGDRPSTPETIAAIRAQYLLDEPFPVRYWHWLSQVLSGDFGTSLLARQPVLTVVGERLPVTATLAGCAMVLTLLLGIPAGMAAGLRRGKPLDQGVTLVALVALSFPPFALGLLLLYGFAVELGWFPTYGGGDLRHYTLPAIALSLGQAAVLVRQTRAATLDVGAQDYVTFARARGLGRMRTWGSYSLRNAALPVLTVAGLLAAANLTGAVFVEQTFSLPGLGSLLVQAVNQKDIALIQALVLLGGAVVIGVNLLVDLVYLVVDPRVRHGAPA
ncbi:ABC transporter permease [Kitasatospora sp. NPDC001547]|uniref:ABC transporter permease n=1 Tax=Kitasatospora sp. NPDC001547 TaxID=3364015 RepID=UPI00369A0428